MAAVGLLVAPNPPAARAGDLPAPPLISTDPNCAGQTIEGTFPLTLTYHLRNFPPNAQVTVVYGSGTPPQQQTVPVGPYGSADVPLTFDHGASGDLTISAFDSANPAVAASMTLHVPCQPTMRLTPNCDAPADPAAPRNISILAEGANWDPFNGPVQVVLVQRTATGDVPISSTVEVTPTDQLAISAVINAAASFDDVPTPLAALPAGDYFVMALQTRSQLRVDTDFAVPCAQVTLTPNCGDPGGPPEIYDIVVAGSGFRPFVQAQVIFSAADQPQVFLLDVGASGQLLIGDVEEARIKPFRRPELPGSAYAVAVRQVVADGISREVAVPFVVPCPPPPPTPTLTIEPVCGPPQLLGDVPQFTTLRVVGESLPSALMTITVQPAPGQQPDVKTFGVADSEDLSFDIPRRPRGTYAIDASFVDGNNVLLFSIPFTFTVPCRELEATLQLRCDRETTNPPELRQVLVRAAGFYPNAPLQLIVGGVTETVTTDANGSYARDMPSTSFPMGPLAASATQLDSNQVVAATATPRRTLTLPCRTRNEPMLTISPSAGAPGLVVVVLGFDFRPNAAVSLRWSQGIGSTRTIDVVTDAEGEFERQVLIFHHDFAGARQLVVESSDDPLATGISADYVVAPGRGSPPAFSDSGLPGFPPLIFRR